ncbi:hypothetical protein FIV41_20685 [Pseudomonas marginalis]|uniref:Uncharacterized protein n=1 Tax=Pseudomonas marginalis TaxID=298 RepID=A0A9X9FWI8_PSEMA|nr:hypothetical protein FIV41_20685 [Pseudomonas marginalis]
MELYIPNGASYGPSRSSARIAIGSFGGTLKNTPLASLATAAVKGALAHAGIGPCVEGRTQGLESAQCAYPWSD